MKEIKDFLNNNKFFKTKSSKESVIEVIKNIAGIEVSNDFIIFRGDTIFLSINPKSKRVIITRKQEILKEISLKKEISFFKDIV